MNTDFIQNEFMKDYCEIIMKAYKGKHRSLRHKFGKSSPQLLEILESMLQFNPDKRLQAS